MDLRSNQSLNFKFSKICSRELQRVIRGSSSISSHPDASQQCSECSLKDSEATWDRESGHKKNPCSTTLPAPFHRPSSAIAIAHLHHCSGNHHLHLTVTTRRRSEQQSNPGSGKERSRARGLPLQNFCCGSKREEGLKSAGFADFNSSFAL